MYLSFSIYSELIIQDYFLDAPVSVGDDFSFSGGLLEFLKFNHGSTVRWHQIDFFCLWKYLDGSTPSDEWFKKGKFVRFSITLHLIFFLIAMTLWNSVTLIQVKAYPVSSSGEKAKDPIFGLTMGQSSQAASDLFRWIWLIYLFVLWELAILYVKIEDGLFAGLPIEYDFVQ